LKGWESRIFVKTLMGSEGKSLEEMNQEKGSESSLSVQVGFGQELGATRILKRNLESSKSTGRQGLPKVSWAGEDRFSFNEIEGFPTEGKNQWKRHWQSWAAKGPQAGRKGGRPRWRFGLVFESVFFGEAGSCRGWGQSGIEVCPSARHSRRTLPVRKWIPAAPQAMPDFWAEKPNFPANCSKDLAPRRLGE